jgi:hypothetical protein
MLRGQKTKAKTADVANPDSARFTHVVTITFDPPTKMLPDDCWGCTWDVRTVRPGKGFSTLALGENLTPLQLRTRIPDHTENLGLPSRICI